MQNIDVRFNATSNFTKVRGDLAALQAQAASLNAVFEKGAYAKTPALVNPTAWAEGTAAVNRASRVYRDAASSSGLLTTQQIRATSEAERYTKALQKQKLSLGDMMKHQGIMKEVYNDQLRMQRMSAKFWGTDQMGRAVTDIAIPKGVPEELDTMRRRMGMFGSMAASAGTQVVNLGKNIQWSGRQLTVGLTYPMAMVGAAAGVMAYKVEDAFASINKVYDVSKASMTDDAARTKELGDVRVKSMALAKTAAEEYGATVQSTLQIEQALAATGMTVSSGLLESTKEVQRISRLGDIDAGQTTDMVIALKNAFKDEAGTAKGMTNTLNFMNAASNATSLSLQDIADSTPRAASAMSALGVTAKQMTVMLVSMNEAGVNAAEGANALKSATGTILKPSPAALKFIQDIAGPKLAAGVENLGKTSKGNLYLAMQQLFQLTKGLSDLKRQQILVSLFGKYQFNRVSAMLKNLGAAFDGTQNQARKAMDLMGNSASENAKIAANSLDAMTQNAAGRFKSAIAQVQIALADVGKPFLTAAAVFLEGVAKIAKGFNQMADWKKHTALVIAGALALAGPLIMTAGLMFNLTGQFIKGIGAISKFSAWIGPAAGRFRLLTKEEQAAALTTEAQNKALAAQTTATSNLVTETQVLIAAMEKAQQSVVARLEAEGMLTAEMNDEAATAAKVAEEVVAAETAKQEAIAMTAAEAQAANEKMFAASTAAAKRGMFGEMTPMPVPAKAVEPVVKTITHPYTGMPITTYTDKAATASRVAAAEAEAAALNKANVERAALVNKSNASLAIQNKVNQSIGGGNIAMGAMGISMAAMMVTSNHVVDSIAKWAMVGTIAVPAMKGMLAAVGGIGTGMMKSVNTFRLANAGAVGLTGAMGAAGAAAKGFGASLNAAMGPVGWIVLGLTAVAGVFLAIKHHNDEIQAKQRAFLKNQIDANKALQTSSASIATSLGKSAGAYKQIVDIGGQANGGSDKGSQMLKRFDYYKSSEGSKETAALDLTDDDRLIDQVREKFINLQIIGSDTAEQAKTDIQAMLMAAGTSSIKAAQMAEQVFKTYGNISSLDWTKPMEDQATAMSNIAASGLLDSKQVSYGRWGSAMVYEVNPTVKGLIEDQAARAAKIFEQALQSASNPTAEAEIIKRQMDLAMKEWDKGWNNLMGQSGNGFDQIKEKFKEFGITSSKDFAAAWDNNDDFRKAITDTLDNPSYAAANAAFKQATLSGSTWEKAVIVPTAKNSGILADNIWNVVDATKGYTDAGIGVTADDAAANLMKQNKAYQQHALILEQIQEIHSHGDGGKSRGTELLNLQSRLHASDKQLVKDANELNQQYGFKQGKTATEAMYNLLHHVRDAAKGATEETKKLDKSLHTLPTRMNINISVKSAIGVVKDSMAAVQSDMADSAMTKFNDDWDKSMASAQASWDNRMSNLEARQQTAQDHLQASHERGQAALERQQQNAQAAFDARWEKRKNAVTAAYDSRIKAIQNEIEAEKAADETRQRLFEAEKARLQKLADAENNNIDFNTALNSGNLDEAAKIQNNAGAKSASDQMDAEQKAAEQATAAKVSILEKKNARLEAQRDKEIKQLEKMEERQRKHLERMQQARSKALEKAQAQEDKALEKSQAKQTEALQKREDAAMKSLQKQRDYDEAMLQQRLELFKSYTARNQKDLEKWMKEVGLSYDDFGKDVKAKGESWSKYFRKALSDHIRQAGTDVMNDNIWSKVGKEMGDKIVKGLGFRDMGDFRHFVKTGDMGGGKVSGGGGSKGGLQNQKGNNFGGSGPAGNNLVSNESRHEGGFVGSGKGSRKGVAPTYKGLHRSEKMIRAQKGEFVVNKDASKKHADTLGAINSGKDPLNPNGVMGGMSDTLGGSGFNLSGGPGIGGLVSGMIGMGLQAGITKALQNTYATAQAKYAALAAAAGGSYAGAAGKYGSRTFSAEQMKNAATIASVGSSMGMSKRDIEIGIMTAITESGLVNIHGGDRDSQGLFQQRPSMGWGTIAQVTDPQYASQKFFSVLKSHSDRDQTSPWMAAQNVQRSGTPDGSNYQQYWDEAIAIFTKGLKSSGGGVSGGYVAGTGGRHRPINAPVTSGLHDEYTGYPAYDFAGPKGTPVHAVADGVISRSYDIRGSEPRRITYGHHSEDGYRSYGRVVYLKTDAGPEVLYAHLDRRSVPQGARVRGGATLGYRGNTGHVVSSTGDGSHLHFGATNGPAAWLRKGGEIKWDNTPAVLHQGETVLTKSLTNKFKESVSGKVSGGDTFRVTLDLRGATIKEDVDIERAVNKALDVRENKLGRKRVVR